MYCELLRNGGLLLVEGRAVCWKCKKRVPSTVTAATASRYRRFCGEIPDVPIRVRPEHDFSNTAEVIGPTRDGRRFQSQKSGPMGGGKHGALLRDNEAWQDVVERTRTLLRDSAIAAGVIAEEYDEWVSKHAPPPVGCYEKKCWWLKKFAKQFGQEKADALKATLFDGKPPSE